MEYSFSQVPRAVKPSASRARYRPETGDDGYDAAHPPGFTQNLMFDRRVIRGNTYSGIIAAAGQGSGGGGEGIPQGNDTAGTGRLGKGSTRRRKKKYIDPQPASLFDLRPEVERHDAVDLTPYLVAASDSDRRVEVSVSSQTDKMVDLPPPVPYVPLKTGVDAATQIEPEDNLFKFDVEVEPILEVLVGKTLEQSLQEVQEEAELEHLRGRKVELRAARAKEDAEIRDMEKTEHELWNRKEELRLAELDREAREKTLKNKIMASYMAKTMVSDGAIENIFSRLESGGTFREPTRASIEDSFMPWVMDIVGGRMDQVTHSRRLVDDALQRALQRRASEEEALRDEQRAKNDANLEPERRFAQEKVGE